MKMIFINNDDFTKQVSFKQPMEMRLAGFLHDKEYLNRTIILSQDHSTYLMLDNGAAEDNAPNDDLLIDYINIVRPQEFVLPDVLRDPIETFAKSTNFLYELKVQKAFHPKLNYVLHFRNIEDLDLYMYDPKKHTEDNPLNNIRKKIFEFIDTHVNVISIPKYVDLWGKQDKEGDRSVITNIIVKRMEEGTFPKREIHWLGANTFDTVYKSSKLIRSCDSALPYICYGFDNFNGHILNYERDLSIQMEFIEPCDFTKETKNKMIKEFEQIRKDLL